MAVTSYRVSSGTHVFYFLFVSLSAVLSKYLDVTC